jgi:hypothetical protein
MELLLYFRTIADRHGPDYDQFSNSPESSDARSLPARILKVHGRLFVAPTVSLPADKPRASSEFNSRLM